MEKTEAWLCGDETGALVADCGSWSIKCGFAGEDINKSDINAIVGTRLNAKKSANNSEYICGQNRLSALMKQVSLENVVSYSKNEQNIDFDKYQKLVEYCFEDVLSSKLTEHPFLACVDSALSLESLSTLSEIFLEKFETQAFYPAPSSMLSCFSTGKQTALVVDLGHSKSSVEAIYDGFRMKRTYSMAAQSFCGLDLNNKIFETFSKKGYKQFFRTDYSKNLHQTVLSWRKDTTLHELKSTFFRLLPEKYSEDTADEYEDEEYELPDRSKIKISKNRFFPGETFVTDDSNKMKDNDQPSSLQEFIKESIFKAHPDLRRELVSNILVVGGTSLLSGLHERLSAEIPLVFSSELRPRVINFPEKFQRKNSSWIGGSVLASLGTFQQLWLSKEEVKEYGYENVILNKCLQ